MGLSAEFEGGERLATLKELGRLVARTIEKCDSGRDMAALARRMQDILAEIEAIEEREGKTEGTPLDELSRRRADAKNRSASG